MNKIKGILSPKSGSKDVAAETMPAPSGPSKPLPPPTVRLLVIGAGSRGLAYSEYTFKNTKARVTAVAEPIASKRQALGRQWIWPDGERSEDQEFETWQDFIKYEKTRREREHAGETVLPGVDGVFVCTLDHTHREIVEALAPLQLHVMCEKPLSINMEDCLRIRNALAPPKGETARTIFSLGHVLRYTPHNALLRKLVLEEQVIGDVLSIEHTEPVGHWHFSHSFVRGNWRKESHSAPSLLTKCCHDIDWLLWMLSTPDVRKPPHLPKTVASTGALTYFRHARKPKAAGNATNCLQCPIEQSCIYSAKRIYLEQQLKHGNAQWPVAIVNPDIEECLETQGREAAEQKLLESLAEDYAADTPASEIEQRPWFGRCVWDADNDVCDDQTVTITWGDDAGAGHWAKTATMHMVAWSREQCSRRGRIYGTRGEIEYDSYRISVDDFATNQRKTHSVGGASHKGHGGGDAGLTKQFVDAIEAVQTQQRTAAEAQLEFIGCTLEDAFRSHALVFAAEEARHTGRAVDWSQWWRAHVDGIGGRRDEPAAGVPE